MAESPRLQAGCRRSQMGAGLPAGAGEGWADRSHVAPVGGEIVPCHVAETLLLHPACTVGAEGFLLCKFSQ
ncbi:MAG: hypothetical protein IJK21_05765 [Prevotella sp.]|nr:hypothetical protein [Prevotella sp.]